MKIPWPEFRYRILGSVVLVLFLSFLLPSIVSAQTPVDLKTDPVLTGENRFCIGLLWCEEKKDGSVSTDALFYLYSSEERKDFSRLAVRPFYSYETDFKNDAVRRSILWPLGTYEKTGDDRWFHLAPFYWHSKSPNLDFTFIPPLLYGDWETPQLTRKFFFPFYGSEETKSTQEHRVSSLGLPPIAALTPYPTLAIYEHLTAKDLVTDRLFPLYRYENNIQQENRRFSLIGYRALSLFWYDANPIFSEHHLFPLYSYEENKVREYYRFGILGYDALSLYHHMQTPSMRVDRLFPLYDYQAEGEDRAVSLIGVSDFAIYRKVTTQTQTQERFFPVYGYRKDQITKETAWDIFLLYQYLQTPAQTRHTLFPLYDYSNDREKSASQFGLLGLSPLSVYYHQSSPSITRAHLFPLYGYRQRSGEGLRFSMLGFPPTDSLITASLYEHTATPMITTDRFFPLYRYFKNHQSGELQWDALLIYQHQQTPTYIKDTLLPFYHYQHDIAEKKWQLGLVGVPPFTLFRQQRSYMETTGHLFPLYNFKNNPETDERKIGFLGYDDFSLYQHKNKPNAVSDYFFPLYGYRQSGASRRFSLLGLPPIGESPSLSLYEHGTKADRLIDRFSPLYAYYRDDRTKERALNLLLLYNHHASPERVEDIFFPLYRYSRNSLQDETRINALLYWHTSTPRSTHDGFFPLYHYEQEKEGYQSISLLGISKYALYRHERQPTLITDQFFPLYRYRHDLNAEKIRFNAMLLFHYKEDTTNRGHFLFPLYSYKNDMAKGEQRIGLLGFAPISLYQHLKTQEKTDDRLLFLYHYRSDAVLKETDFSLLWPLIHYKSQNGKVTETSVLWWLFNYGQPAEGHQEFRILGGPAMAVARSKITPERSVFEFNPIIPFYSYEKEAGKGSEWNLLGGLFGMKTSMGKTKVRLFFFYFPKNPR